jgi:hypothetical protein
MILMVRTYRKLRQHFSYAEYTIRELQKKSGWNDPALIMFRRGSSAEDGFFPCRFSPAPKSSPRYQAARLDEARRIAANVAGIWLILGRGQVRSCLV